MAHKEQKQLINQLNSLCIKGRKKADLEEQIGLPKNSLSAVISGAKEMPAKWIPKIKTFLEQDAKETNLLDYSKPIMVVKNTGEISLAPSEHKLKTFEIEQTKKRIADLEEELKNPPKNPIVGQRIWIAVRKIELRKLKNELLTP